MNRLTIVTLRNGGRLIPCQGLPSKGRFIGLSPGKNNSVSPFYQTVLIEAASSSLDTEDDLIPSGL